MVDILNKIEVPLVPPAEVDLAAEYKRVERGLADFKQGVMDAGDTLLAGQIDITPDGSQVKFHPNGLDPMESVEPLTVEGMLGFRYGNTNAAGQGPSMDCLLWYTLDHSGDLGVFKYVFDARSRSGAWGNRRPATAEQFNHALNGLVSQHNALLADRQGRSVFGVTVPSVAK